MAAQRNPWLSLSMDMMRLGVESQAVMGLRIMKLAQGGAAGFTEAETMVAEKVRAVLDVQTELVAAALTGKGHLAPARSVALYRRRVRANARRLSKAG